ncbi:hypothetical protein GCM10028809_10370 [Spirosoma gilvum]
MFEADRWFAQFVWHSLSELPKPDSSKLSDFVANGLFEIGISLNCQLFEASMEILDLPPIVIGEVSHK